MKKRILSLLLALVMVLSVMTAAVMAKGVQTFADVKESDWFYDAVCYVTDNGLMNGTGSGFAPQQTTSRAMLWAVLSRVDGQNAKRNANDWYAAAQLWAIQHDISDGTAPEAPITREQLAAMLYRYAQRKGLVRAAAYADLSGFADAASVSAYADEALQWAVANGILTGMDGKLCPQGNATRAQVAQILYRLCETWNLLPVDNTAAIASAIYFAENPEHTHVWGEAKPNGNGTHTSTCACGETKTEYCGFPKESGTVTCPTCGFTTEHGVENYGELVQAIQAGWTEIFITGDIEVEAPIKITSDVVIHGVGHTVTLADTYSTTENVKRVFMNVNAALTLDHMLFDGENEENGKLFVVDNGGANGVLTLQDVTIQNFKGTQIVHSEQAKSARFINVKIKDNTLIGIASSGNIGRACLLWMQGTVTEMDNVEITGNVVNTGTNNDFGSGVLIYQRNGGSNFSARKLTVENNKATNHVFANYSATAKNQYIFESGSIKNNTGNFFVAGSMTFGEEMTVESDIVFNNDSAGGVCTLTNNGLIVGDIQASWTDKRGEPIYTGSGTHTGTKTGLTVKP